MVIKSFNLLTNALTDECLNEGSELKRDLQNMLFNLLSSLEPYNYKCKIVTQIHCSRTDTVTETKKPFRNAKIIFLSLQNHRR